jgi:curli production assembly/transport component CsgG
MEVQQLSRFLLGILLFSIVGCTAVQEQEEPVITTTPMVDKLIMLPPPERKVTIAVYKFGDLTGQRKPSDSLALLSTAVTQGAHVWLIQALKRAGKGEWFQVIERIGLDNLLKERQIIRNTRKSYKDTQKIKPLLFAGVLIEGGIVGYDTNMITGGVGARYLGIGIHDEYRRDMVSVGLRLISVQTGEVLMAVSTQKTILSTRIGVNVFKFLDMGTKLLETEAGFSQNESVTYAVRKAIEASVVELIEKGAKKDLWKFKAAEEEKIR